MVTIANALNVLPGIKGGLIIIPGCEPATELTSHTLAANMPCKCAYVYVEDALAAIPGSKIEIMPNLEMVGGRKIFRLPPTEVGCPCPSVNDWYRVLKDLCKPDQECVSPTEFGIAGTPLTESDRWRHGDDTPICSA